MGYKKQRQTVIANILRTETIRNQIDLQKSLTSKGFDVTQATLSRDVRQLEIFKTHDSEGHVYILPDSTIREPRLPTPLFTGATIEFSGNLAVIKTRPGYAMGIASDIDEHASEVILGTIAGDDTILVIPREEFTRSQVKDELAGFLNK